jgi:hypothetical protein
MKRFLPFIVCFALAAPVCAAPATLQPARNAEFLSFAELYRMTVGGIGAVEFGAAPSQPTAAAAQSPAQSPEFQVRVASTEPQAAAVSLVPAAPERASASFSFSTPALPEPASRALLFLSALALAAWVARRRLGYSF